MLNLAAGVAAKTIMSRLLLASLVAAAGGIGWHFWQTGKLQSALSTAETQVERLQANRDAWQRTAEQGAERVRRLEAERAAATEAVQAMQDELAAREPAYEVVLVEIEQAPAGDDGPVAPVLRNALEALR